MIKAVVDGESREFEDTHVKSLGRHGNLFVLICIILLLLVANTVFAFGFLNSDLPITEGNWRREAMGYAIDIGTGINAILLISIILFLCQSLARAIRKNKNYIESWFHAFLCSLFFGAPCFFASKCFVYAIYYIKKAEIPGWFQ